MSTLCFHLPSVRHCASCPPQLRKFSIPQNIPQQCANGTYPQHASGGRTGSPPGHQGAVKGYHRSASQRGYSQPPGYRVGSDHGAAHAGHYRDGVCTQRDSNGAQWRSSGCCPNRARARPCIRPTDTRQAQAQTHRERVPPHAVRWLGTRTRQESQRQGRRCTDVQSHTVSHHGQRQCPSTVCLQPYPVNH